MRLQLESADLLACWGRGPTSWAISYGTASLLAPRGLRLGPSHVAIIAEHNQYGPLWYESTSLCTRPCLFAGEITRGVQAHFPHDRIADYCREGGRVDVYRLTDINRLDWRERALLAQIMGHLINGRVRYDTAGAVAAGERLFNRFGCFPYADLETLFCSEFVGAVLQRLSRMRRRNPSAFNPATLLRCEVRDGVYRLARRFDYREFPRICEC